MLPDQVLKAAQELNAKRLLPVHNSKFSISNHAWNEPLEKIDELNKVTQLSLITPIIGEEVRLKDSTQEFSQWWKDLR